MAGRYGRNSVPSTPGFEPESPGSGAFSPSESRGSATSPKRGRSRADNDQREVYGLKLGLLRQWENEKKDQLLSSEHALQEIAVAKVRGFLDAIGRAGLLVTVARFSPESVILRFTLQAVW
jgi:hypothetical protein